MSIDEAFQQFREKTRKAVVEELLTYKLQQEVNLMVMPDMAIKSKFHGRVAFVEIAPTATVDDLLNATACAHQLLSTSDLNMIVAGTRLPAGSTPLANTLLITPKNREVLLMSSAKAVPAAKTPVTRGVVTPTRGAQQGAQQPVLVARRPAPAPATTSEPVASEPVASEPMTSAPASPAAPATSDARLLAASRSQLEGMRGELRETHGQLRWARARVQTLEEGMTTEEAAKVVVSAGWGGVRACARVFIAGKRRLKGAPDRYSRRFQNVRTGTRRVIGAMQPRRASRASLAMQDSDSQEAE